MEKITTSLELSKELKENGFKQDSIYTLSKDSLSNRYELCFIHPQEIKEDEYSAPTAEELLEELPKDLFINDKSYHLCIYYAVSKYRCIYERLYKEYGCELIREILNKEIISDNEKLCNALAKMWLYLKKNNLLEE